MINKNQFKNINFFFIKCVIKTASAHYNNDDDDDDDKSHIKLYPFVQIVEDIFFKCAGLLLTYTNVH